MSKSYTILRINEDSGTVTALLEYNGKTLQQDVPVDSFDTPEIVAEAVGPFLDKLESDMDAIVLPEVANEVRDMVDQTVEV